jgi:hypothetical protein
MTVLYLLEGKAADEGDDGDVCVLADSAQRGNTFNFLKEFCIRAKARIWPCYVCLDCLIDCLMCALTVLLTVLYLLEGEAADEGDNRDVGVLGSSRCWTNSSHIRQSRPDSGRDCLIRTDLLDGSGTFWKARRPIKAMMGTSGSLKSPIVSWRCALAAALPVTSSAV